MPQASVSTMPGITLPPLVRDDDLQHCCTLQTSPCERPRTLWIIRDWFEASMRPCMGTGKMSLAHLHAPLQYIPVPTIYPQSCQRWAAPALCTKAVRRPPKLRRTTSKACSRVAGSASSPAHVATFTPCCSSSSRCACAFNAVRNGAQSLPAYPALLAYRAAPLQLLPSKLSAGWVAGCA